LKFAETIGDLRKRQIAKQIHKPLKTYRELSEYLCKKYNISDSHLRGCLRRPDAPKKKVKHKSTGAGQNSWYDPVEFILWFKKVINENSGINS